MTSYSVIELPLSDETKDLNRQIDVAKNVSFNHYGRATDDKIREFIKTIGDNSPEVVDSLVRSTRIIIDHVMPIFKRKRSEVTDYWLSIRAYVPCDHFEIPRFHCDGPCYEADENTVHSRFITTLVGPGTIVSDFVATKEFKDVGKNPHDYRKDPDAFRIAEKGIRLKRQEMIGDNYKHVGPNDGLIITCGGNNRTVHSEPDITEKRFLVSLVSGTARQIQNKKARDRFIPKGWKLLKAE